MIQGTDMEMKPYIAARFIHAVIAAAVTVPLFRVLAPSLAMQTLAASLPWGGLASSWPARLQLAAAMFLSVLGALVVWGILLCLVAPKGGPRRAARSLR